MSSFRRKQYGRVKPVPKPKPKAPIKPSVLELKSIFRNIQKSPEWKTLDHISEALIWWQAAMKYVNFHYAKKPQSLETAQAMVVAQRYLAQGHGSPTNAEKKKLFILVLEKYARWAAPVLKTPDVKPFLSKSKEVTKKTVAVNKALAVRYDKILTLLSQCFKSNTLELKVVAEIDGGLDRKYDHAISTMYYSRAHVNEMKSVLYKKGLLSLVIIEAAWIARGMAFLDANKDGTFIIDYKYQLSAYEQLMLDFAEFAATKDAPKTFVRRAKRASKPKEDMSWVKGTNKISKLGPLSKAIKKVGYKPGARALKNQATEV